MKRQGGLWESTREGKRMARIWEGTSVSQTGLVKERRYVGVRVNDRQGDAKITVMFPRPHTGHLELKSKLPPEEFQVECSVHS